MVIPLIWLHAQASGSWVQEGQVPEQKKGFLASLFGRDTKPAVKEPPADKVNLDHD